MLPMVVLAAGGSGRGIESYVRALLQRKVSAGSIELPRRGRFPVKAEMAVPSFIQEARRLAGRAAVVAGGHSYGGRVASLASLDAGFAGLLLFSYPLHVPGHPDADIRTRHWPRIPCPVLLLSGDRDPFARLDLLRAASRQLTRAELVVYSGIGHDLAPVLDDAMDRAARFVRGLGVRP